MNQSSPDFQIRVNGDVAPKGAWKTMWIDGGVFPLPLQPAGVQGDPQLMGMGRAREGIPSKFGS